MSELTVENTQSESASFQPVPLPQGKSIEVFYDGECPLCIREIRMLQRWDKKNRIVFTDIAATEFERRELPLSHEQLMAEINGRLPDGTFIKGVEVFRRLYSAVGFSWVVAATRLPLVSHALDLGYNLFARNRLRLTGRCSADQCELPS